MADKNLQIETIKKDFDKLAATSGKLSKQKLINSFKGTITNRALRMYLDPNVKFKLKSNAEGATPTFDNFFAMCKYLQENEGKNVEAQFVDSIRSDLRDFTRNFLRGNLSLGVNAEDFNSCNTDKPIQIYQSSKTEERRHKPKRMTVLNCVDDNDIIDEIANVFTTPFELAPGVEVPQAVLSYESTSPFQKIIVKEDNLENWNGESEMPCGFGNFSIAESDVNEEDLAKEIIECQESEQDLEDMESL